jgi:hypothetical protein
MCREMSRSKGRELKERANGARLNDNLTSRSGRMMTAVARESKIGAITLFALRIHASSAYCVALASPLIDG